MEEKTKRLKAKVLHKHELEVDWLKSTKYIPEKGELVVYDAEVDKEGNVLELPEGRETPYTYPRMKIGDGIHTLSQLPFTVNNNYDHIITTEEEFANLDNLTGRVLIKGAGLHSDGNPELRLTQPYEIVLQVSHIEIDGWIVLDMDTPDVDEEIILYGVGASIHGGKIGFNGHNLGFSIYEFNSVKDVHVDFEGNYYYIDEETSEERCAENAFYLFSCSNISNCCFSFLSSCKNITSCIFDAACDDATDYIAGCEYINGLSLNEDASIDISGQQIIGSSYFITNVSDLIGLTASCSYVDKDTCPSYQGNSYITADEIWVGPDDNIAIEPTGITLNAGATEGLRIYNETSNIQLSDNTLKITNVDDDFTTTIGRNIGGVDEISLGEDDLVLDKAGIYTSSYDSEGIRRIDVRNGHISVQTDNNDGVDEFKVDIGVAGDAAWVEVKNPNGVRTLIDSDGITTPKLTSTEVRGVEGYFGDEAVVISETIHVMGNEVITSSNPTLYSSENAFLPSEKIIDGITYKLSNSMTNYTCEKAEPDIMTAKVKKSIVGIPVTSISGYAFSECRSLTSVTIPDSVTSIGDRAFSDCTSLTSVTIPNSVTSIGERAFYKCTSLTSVTIPDSVTSISGYAFYKCTSLTSVTIGNSVTSIGYNAFEGCTSLTSVTIPDSVTSIGYNAFYGCHKLVEVIDLSSLNITKGSSSNGDVGYYAIEVHKGESKTVNYNDYLFYTYDGVNYLLGYVGKDKALTLPEGYRGENYEIYEYAFYERDDITSAIIPEGVTGIGERAFYNCTNFENVAISDSVTHISDKAFYGCSSLAEINVSDGNTAYKSIDGNLYPKDGTILIQYALGKTDTSFTIPDGVTSIGNNAMFNCASLAEVVVPNGVTSIGDGAFDTCINLVSVHLPDSVISIGQGAFYSCTNLTEIAIPDSVTSIGYMAFHSCSSLTSMIIGNGITSIDAKAFRYCGKLTDIYYTGTEEEWQQIEIGSKNEYLTNATIHYNYNSEV